MYISCEAWCVTAFSDAALPNLLQDDGLRVRALRVGQHEHFDGLREALVLRAELGVDCFGLILHMASISNRP